MYLFSAQSIRKTRKKASRQSIVNNTVCPKWNANALEWIADLTTVYTAITVCSCRMYEIHTIRAYCACNHLLNIQRRTHTRHRLNREGERKNCFSFVWFRYCRRFAVFLLLQSIPCCCFSVRCAFVNAMLAAYPSVNVRVCCFLLLYFESVYASYVLHACRSLSGHMEFIECVSYEWNGTFRKHTTTSGPYP